MLLQIFSGTLAIFLLFVFPMHGATACGNALEANLFTFRNTSNRHSITKNLKSEPAACATFRRQPFTKNNAFKSSMQNDGYEHDANLTRNMHSPCLHENRMAANVMFRHPAGRFFTDSAAPAKHLKPGAVNVRAGPEPTTGYRQAAES